MAEHSVIRLDAANNTVLVRCSRDTTTRPQVASVVLDADPEADPAACPHCLTLLTAVITVTVHVH